MHACSIPRFNVACSIPRFNISGARVQVVFLPSFSEAERGVLLGHARGVVYTPHEEHFGIVPLEAM